MSKTARASYAPHTAKHVDNAVPVKKAASEIGCHPETLRRLIREGRVKAERALNLPGHGYALTPAEIARIKRDGIDYTKVLD